MTSVIRFAFFFLVLSALGTAHFLFAQGTDLGTIRGTVEDPSGAVIANASVTIVDLATSTLRHTETNPHGEYQMFGLPSGTYKVTITAPGMTSHDITGIVLRGSDTANANAVLKISSATESVVVSTETPTINTADQTIADTITGREVPDLPRDSRDISTAVTRSGCGLGSLSRLGRSRLHSVA